MIDQDRLGSFQISEDRHESAEVEREKRCQNSPLNEQKEEDPAETDDVENEKR